MSSFAMSSSLESSSSRSNSSTSLRPRPSLDLQPQQQSSRLMKSPDHTRRSWTIALFSITTLLLFADQNLMAPNLTDIANEFGFDAEERDRKLGGDISLAFFLIGAPASMVIGCLTDSSDRSVVFAWTVFIGEGACLATYWVQNYSQLYICRAITGFSVGGAVPLIYSVLGDLFAAENRHVVSALVSFGTGAGIAVGQAVAGFLGPVFGWRFPFLVVAIPALATAAMVLFTVPDPERGAMDIAALECCDDTDSTGVALVDLHPTSHRYNVLPTPPKEAESPQNAMVALNGTQVADEYFDGVCEDYYSSVSILDLQIHLRTMIKLLSTPTVLLAIIQGAPGCITWGIINVFLNDFLSEDRGFTVQMATTTLMFFSLGNGLGLFLLGGGMGQRLYRMDKRYPALLAGASAILGCWPLWLLFNKIDVETAYWKVVSVSILAGFGSGPTGPIIKATLTNVTHPRTRGQAFAFFNLFDDFGKGLGPFFVSLLISAMGGRLLAFNVGILGWVICGIANLAIYCFVEQDEVNMQLELSPRHARDLSV